MSALTPPKNSNLKVRVSLFNGTVVLDYVERHYGTIKEAKGKADELVRRLAEANR